MLRNRHNRFRQSLQGFVLACLFASAPSTWAGAPPFSPEGIENLRRAATGSLSVSLDRATGTVSFIRAEPGALPVDPAARVSRRAATLAFLERHGKVFGLRQPANELQFLNEITDALGHSHVSYRQVYQGVPVFASDLRSHFDRSGELTRVTATTIPILKLDPNPRIDVAEARAIAVSEISRQSRFRAPTPDLQASEGELLVFRSGLLRGVQGRNHLAYRVEVTNDKLSVREFVFVDAHSGEVIDQISGIYQAIDREIYNGGLAPQYQVWSEGDAVPYGGSDATGINHLIEYALDTYNLFMTLSNGSHPSYDASDSTMSSVLNDPAIQCPNATWNGVSTNYCNNVSGDDTVAHEWTHAYTEYSHDLVYQWQPGALNESFSDIFGEVVDMLNGAGTDLPDAPRATNGGNCSLYGEGLPASDDSYRWLSGEDDPAFGGAIRDLWRPECYGDPGRVGSTSYFCSTADYGGVHINSGVPNHAFALAVDGGSYNGQTVAGLGLTKAAHVYWRAMTVYQGPASDFADHADALEAACADLVGVNLPQLSTDSPTPSPSGVVLSAPDCGELGDAIAATELRDEPARCLFQAVLEPDPPALCFGHGELSSIASTDWESGLAPWTAGTHDVAKPTTFDTPDWAVVTDLPSARPGQAAFVANLDQGNCVSDDESGALNLDSPLITIPAGTVVPRVAVDHWLATEAGYDGGNFKLSVNGGPYTLIPSSSIDFNPYNTTLITAPDNTNPLEGEEAFSGVDEGQVSGSWGQSHINLYGLAGPGDEIRFRFDFGVDGCSGVTGWYVDDVQFYSCSAELPPSSCGNGALDAGEQCDDGNTYIGDGCSNSCQVEAGWECTDPIPAGTVLDPGFEAGTPNPSWAESSTNFGTPICSEADCGLGGGSGSASGDWWAWFGGATTNEDGSLSQTVTIPTTATSLDFQLEISACDSPADYLEVLIDGNREFIVDGSSALCEVIGYSTQSVDIRAYADGGSHSLEFHGHTVSSNLDVSNFFVDDVSIPGQPSQCSATGPTLTLVKTVTNDNGGTLDIGDFALFIDGNPATSGVAVPLSVGAHVASETNQTGYAAGAWGGDCDAAGNVTLAAGENKTCTITNDDQQATITVVKAVTNDNGGTAAPNDFLLTLEGNPVSSGVAVPVNPGTYTAGETPLPGYTFEGFSGDCDSNGDITVALGENKTCTLSNDDQQATITVIKAVTNDNGGTAAPNDFLLTLEGSPVTSGVAIQVDPGTYTAGETPLPGYAFEGYSGDCDSNGDVTVALGESKTCTLSNNDSAPTLTLVKTVTNNDGGGLNVGDFPLFIDGNPATSGVAVELSVGAHVASETNQPGYAAGNWGGDCDAAGNVTLALGEHKTCTITNDDVAPTLTLVKMVTNDNGGTLDVGDFPLFIDGNPATSGVAVELSVGAHVASETNQPGYAAGDWGGDCDAAGNVSLALGEDKTCTITNDDIAPTLAVSKIIVNDNGGSIEDPNAFGLRVDGNLVIHGVANAFSAGLHTVSEDGAVGYTPGAWDGDCNPDGSISLSLGQVATCSITNDDSEGTSLTLVKQVVNLDGGTAQPSAWMLSAVGTSTPLSGPGPTVSSGPGFEPGTYTLSESSGPDGYAAGNWNCEGVAVNGNQITLGLGDSAICTIVNDDIAPTLTLVKTVTNDHGGKLDVGDFPLFIDGNPATSGIAVELSAGAHIASETNQPGYAAGDWGGDCDAAGSVTLALGEDKTCTITNNDVPIEQLIFSDGFESQ